MNVGVVISGRPVRGNSWSERLFSDAFLGKWDSRQEGMVEIPVFFEPRLASLLSVARVNHPLDQPALTGWQ